MKIDEDLAAVAAFTEAEQFADVRRHSTPSGYEMRWRRPNRNGAETNACARGAGGVVGDRDGDVSEVADSRSGGSVESGATRSHADRRPEHAWPRRAKRSAQSRWNDCSICAPESGAHASARRHAWRGLAMYGV